MKISSRSILSPARAGAARDPPISLSTSLSRRLRTNRSIKGGASPAMFPATGKKKGCGFENPEPSSPKVTCIGQVRVKSKKKHAKNLRTLSRRRSTGDVSFRKLEHSHDGFSNQSQHLGSNYPQGGYNQHPNQECLSGQRNNQRWVHLPLTICEALRAFGSEFSCMFPCRSSCFSTTGTDKEEKMAAGSVEGGNRHGSCGAVFARWLVALQDGDGGGRGDRDDAGGDGREIELVAGDDDVENEDMGVRNARRHVFQDLEIVNDSILGTNDEARVSICVPPKNALLLMRCRSDPMKMEALTNRFWQPTVGKNEEEDEEFVDDEHESEEKRVPQDDLQLRKEDKVMALVELNDKEHGDLPEDAVDEVKVETSLEMDMKQSIGEEEDDEEQGIETKEEESMFLGSLFEDNADQYQELQENDEAQSDMEDAREELFDEGNVQEIEAGESNIEEDFEEKNEEEIETELTDRAERQEVTQEEVVMGLEEIENGVLARESEVKEERQSSSGVLPNCLLLMMYEPKLSMEVSKETWVCSTDFIGHHSGRKKPPPPPPVKSIYGEDESKINTATTTSGVTTKERDNHVMKTAAIQYQPVLQQPARFSCSLPAPPSMATMLEQKLVNTVGYEPIVLTRCKSEPMRTAAAKLAPETCFWKNRKLEPLRRASFGIGVAGLGF